MNHIAEKQRKIIERNKLQQYEDAEQVEYLNQWNNKHPNAWGPAEFTVMCMVGCIIIAVAASLAAMFRPAVLPQRTAVATVVVPVCNRCHISEGRIKSLKEYRTANPSPRERRMKIKPVDLAELVRP